MSFFRVLCCILLCTSLCYCNECALINMFCHNSVKEFYENSCVLMCHNCARYGSGKIVLEIYRQFLENIKENYEIVRYDTKKFSYDYLQIKYYYNYCYGKFNVKIIVGGIICKNKDIVTKGKLDNDCQIVESVYCDFHCVNIFGRYCAYDVNYKFYELFDQTLKISNDPKIYAEIYGSIKAIEKDLNKIKAIENDPNEISSHINTTHNGNLINPQNAQISRYGGYDMKNILFAAIMGAAGFFCIFKIFGRRR